MQRPRFTTGGRNLVGRHFTDDDEGGIEFEVDDAFYDETGNSVLAKYWDTAADKPQEECELDFILTSAFIIKVDSLIPHRIQTPTQDRSYRK